MPNKAAAVIMPGTMIGSIRQAVMKAAPGTRPRTRPRDAAVPRTVARIDDGTMSWTLTHSALVHAGVENSTAYQRSEKPGGGNCRKGAELNEMITTTASGASRKTATMTTSV